MTALDFDPRGTPAERYLADLRRSGVIELASPSGLAGWRAAHPSVAADERGTRLYTAVQVSFLPDGVGMAGAAADRWIPNGSLTPVTAALS